MSTLIFFYKYHVNLSKPEIEILNVIYSTPFYVRSFLDVFLKFIILGICLVCVMGVLYVCIKHNFMRNPNFIFTVLASLNIFSISVYCSFIFWSSTNAFRTQSFPNSTRCLSRIQLHLERNRVALYHWSATAEMWLTIFISVLHLNCLKKKELLIPLNAILPPRRLALGVISVLFVSAFAALPEVLFTEIIPDPNRKNELCHAWKTSQAYSVTSLLLEEIGPTLVILGLAVIIKIELNSKSKRVKNQLGKRTMRSMSTKINKNINSAQGLKKSLFYLLVIMFLTSFPSCLRHFLILVGLYDTNNYLLDEKCCDFLNCFMLMNASFPVAFCFNLKRRIQEEHFTAQRSKLNKPSLKIQHDSFDLNYILGLERDFNKEAEQVCMHRNKTPKYKKRNMKGKLMLTLGTEASRMLKLTEPLASDIKICLSTVQISKSTEATVIETALQDSPRSSFSTWSESIRRLTN